MAAWKSARFWMGGLLVCTWAASAQAQDCEKNEDCEKGFTCETNAASPDCAPPPSACAPGASCPAPEPCAKPAVTRSCQPGTCASDADCDARMRCFKQTVSDCDAPAGAPACAPGETCTMPEPPPAPRCGDREIAQCVPRYVLPCQQASDCGEGFACEAGEECTCSGSAPAARDAGAPRPGMGGDQNGFAPVPPPADAGVDAAVSGEPPVCDCHPTEHKACVLNVITCSRDEDCPSDFACVTYADGGSVSCAVPDGGDAACAPQDKRPEEKRCQPRYHWATAGGVKGGDAAPGTPTYEQGGDRDESAPPRGDFADAGVAAPEVPSDGEPAAEEMAACSVVRPRAGKVGAVLGFVMLGVGWRLRRRRG